MLDTDLLLSEKDDCDLLHSGEIDHREFNRRNQRRYAIQDERRAKKRAPWWAFWKRKPA
jgi:hypothetical protein